MIERNIKRILLKLSLTGLLISVPVLILGQTVEPPLDADEFGWMRWSVVVLLGFLITVMGSFYAYVINSHKNRINDKDDQISELRGEIVQINNKIDQLIKDKDLLQKDIRDKVIPALISSTELLKNLLNKNL